SLVGAAPAPPITGAVGRARARAGASPCAAGGPAAAALGSPGMSAGEAAAPCAPAGTPGIELPPDWTAAAPVGAAEPGAPREPSPDGPAATGRAARQGRGAGADRRRLPEPTPGR